jgi:radical SAM superfamily enzyme YgiQ (UPF0313 family)
VEELLAALEPLSRRWVCQISIDAARDLDLLRRMRRAGCRVVVIGFESLNTDSLRQMNKGANIAVGAAGAQHASKGANAAVDYDEVIGNIHRAGLMLYGTFVIGYDGDGPGTALELAAFARGHGFAIANFNPLIPTPGTKLYARLEREGLLLFDRWWLDPDYRYGDTIFKPKGMTPQELADSCRKARYSFYSLRGILSRLRGVNVRGLFNLWVYLLANVVSGVSIRQKQGRRLGE